ncbi:MAG: hypothetical protein J6K38_05055 [Alistipes sp.]|nr:hypothetical protein [Alistipes sp.]
MRIACSLWLVVAAVAAVACGGGDKRTAATSDPAAVSPAEQARRLSADYASLAADYDALCGLRREALAEPDEVRRGECLAATDSMISALAVRSRELDARWWSYAAEYRGRGDGSFTEFCREAEIDSARVDVETYLITGCQIIIQRL